jgi:hypothetical protein
MGSRTDLRLAEPVPATARALRKAGGHSRGISVPGMRSDLLAIPSCRLGDGGEHWLCPQHIDPSSRPAYYWATP